MKSYSPILPTLPIKIICLEKAKVPALHLRCSVFFMSFVRSTSLLQVILQSAQQSLSPPPPTPWLNILCLCRWLCQYISMLLSVYLPFSAALLVPFLPDDQSHCSPSATLLCLSLHRVHLRPSCGNHPNAFNLSPSCFGIPGGFSL